MASRAWSQRVCVLALALLALCGCLQPARAQTCRWSVRRRSGWTGTAFPLSIAELKVVGSASGPLTATFSPSSNWGPNYLVASLSDTQASTFWASANADPTPRLDITWTCVPGERVRLALTNRQRNATSYNNCNQDCVNRLSSFSVFEETDPAGNTLATPVEHKLMWWSPSFVLAAPPAANALLPLPWSSSTAPFVIYSSFGERNCFVWVSPTVPPPVPVPTNFSINLNEVAVRYGALLTPATLASGQLYAAMTGTYTGYEVGKCFDGIPTGQNTTCASTSPPLGPRMVIAGPCANTAGESALAVQLDIMNRPSSSPRCVGCADRIASFTFSAAYEGDGDAALVLFTQSFTPTVPVPSTLGPYLFSASLGPPARGLLCTCPDGAPACDDGAGITACRAPPPCGAASDVCYRSLVDGLMYYAPPQGGFPCEQPACTSDSQCAVGEACVFSYCSDGSLRCLPIAPAAPPQGGFPCEQPACTSDSQCAAGEACVYSCCSDGSLRCLPIAPADACAP